MHFSSVPVELPSSELLLPRNSVSGVWNQPQVELQPLVAQFFFEPQHQILFHEQELSQSHAFEDGHVLAHNGRESVTEFEIGGVLRLLHKIALSVNPVRFG